MSYGSPFVALVQALSSARRAGPLLVLLAVCPGASSTPTPQGASGQVVARLETRTPPLSDFLLRGTVPLPPGTFLGASSLGAFTILDYDGTPLLTQTEVVSRYPNKADGADVVEVLARVRPRPNVPIGAPMRYSVVLNHPTPVAPERTELFPDELIDQLFDPEGILITAYDCFGNRYVCRPLLNMGDFDLLHHGPVHAETRVYKDMLPEPALPGSTLPHLFGVHSYVSWFRQSSLLGLNLRFHNAHDGHDRLDPSDDPLGKIYFQRIEISVPRGWVVLQDFDDPLFGSERFADGRRIVSLVAPEPAGGMHVMRWQGQFHRRLMLAPDRPETRHEARAHLDGAGRAFCVRGNSFAGRELWSWWNRQTGRYFPQRLPLPLLDHVGRDTLDASLAAQYAKLVGHLASGTGTGDYPFASGRLGWGHPYGVSYGGMTSGLEIQFYDGIETAAAASPQGLQLYTLLHRMQTDRQPNALFRAGGDPSSVEEWLIENGQNDYVPFEHFVVPLVFGSRPDPFGVRDAPTFQVDYVAANGLKPAYEDRHLAYDPHDYQHFVRYTRSAKVLAWLGNDALAIDDLVSQAEGFHLAFHPYANTPSGGAQGSGMLSMLRFVEQFPGKGFAFGRGEAWGIDCAVAAYSLGRLTWREQKLPWFEQQVEMLVEGQAACSGFIQALVSNKAFDGKYRARQAIEQSITENALVGLHESVFRDASPPHASMVRDVLEASLRAFIGEMSWFPGQPGPWRYTGVGPIDPGLQPWCAQSEMAPDAWTVGDIEAYQDWCSLAYGYELTGDPKFLRYARLQSGAASFMDLVQRLHNAGTNNLGNRAALLQTVQRLQGLL